MDVCAAGIFTRAGKCGGGGPWFRRPSRWLRGARHQAVAAHLCEGRVHRAGSQPAAPEGVAPSRRPLPRSRPRHSAHSSPRAPRNSRPHPDVPRWANHVLPVHVSWPGFVKQHTLLPVVSSHAPVPRPPGSCSASSVPPGMDVAKCPERP